MHGRRLATTEEIIAITSPGSEETLATLRSWVDEHDVDLTTVSVGEDLGRAYQEERATLGITLGGDGTFLEGIKTFAPNGIPLLGVNTGTLAFLARVDPDDLEAALDEIIQGRSTVDNRQQLYAQAKGVETMGINDVMIQHVPPENPVDRKVTRLHAYAGDEYIGQYEGTGLAISTPTGSTGISLSADGPVHYPIDNATLQLVPLHTHHIGVRPVVVSADTEIRVVSEGPANLLVDGGRSHTILQPDDVVTITGADQPAYVIRTSFDDQFFTAIDDKLGWSIRPDPDGPRDRLEDHRPRSREPDDVIDRAMRVALEAAESAGEVLRERHGQVESVEFKTDKSDIVTEADYQSDRIITTVIEN
ncbi:MAG: NAD(+)/NADH kinase, partial [Halobacteriales archaeon]|nr:NAD(+)/NADH kinase [Halobacteriales archaeon]